MADNSRYEDLHNLINAANNVDRSASSSSGTQASQGSAASWQAGYNVFGNSSSKSLSGRSSASGMTRSETEQDNPTHEGTRRDANAVETLLDEAYDFGESISNAPSKALFGESSSETLGNIIDSWTGHSDEKVTAGDVAQGVAGFALDLIPSMFGGILMTPEYAVEAATGTDLQSRDENNQILVDQLSGSQRLASGAWAGLNLISLNPAIKAGSAILTAGAKAGANAAVRAAGQSAARAYGETNYNAALRAASRASLDTTGEQAFNRTSTVAKGWIGDIVEGGIVEGGAEFGQTLAEQTRAEQDWDFYEAAKAGAMGALGGMMFGGVSGHKTGVSNYDSRVAAFNEIQTKNREWGRLSEEEKKALEKQFSDVKYGSFTRTAKEAMEGENFSNMGKSPVSGTGLLRPSGARRRISTVSVSTSYIRGSVLKTLDNDETKDGTKNFDTFKDSMDKEVSKSGKTSDQLAEKYINGLGDKFSLPENEQPSLLTLFKYSTDEQLAEFMGIMQEAAGGRRFAMTMNFGKSPATNKGPYKVFVDEIVASPQKWIECSGLLANAINADFDGDTALMWDNDETLADRPYFSLGLLDKVTGGIVAGDWLKYMFIDPKKNIKDAKDKFEELIKGPIDQGGLIGLDDATAKTLIDYIENLPDAVNSTNLFELVLKARNAKGETEQNEYMQQAIKGIYAVLQKVNEGRVNNSKSELTSEEQAHIVDSFIYSLQFDNPIEATASHMDEKITEDFKNTLNNIDADGVRGVERRLRAESKKGGIYSEIRKVITNGADLDLSNDDQMRRLATLYYTLCMPNSYYDVDMKYKDNPMFRAGVFMILTGVKTFPNGSTTDSTTNDFQNMKSVFDSLVSWVAGVEWYVGKPRDVVTGIARSMVVDYVNTVMASRDLSWNAASMDDIVKEIVAPALNYIVDIQDKALKRINDTEVSAPGKLVKIDEKLSNKWTVMDTLFGDEKVSSLFPEIGKNVGENITLSEMLDYARKEDEILDDKLADDKSWFRDVSDAEKENFESMQAVHRTEEERNAEQVEAMAGKISDLLNDQKESIRNSVDTYSAKNKDGDNSSVRSHMFLAVYELLDFVNAIVGGRVAIEAGIASVDDVIAGDNWLYNKLVNCKSQQEVLGTLLQISIKGKFDPIFRELGRLRYERRDGETKEAFEKEGLTIWNNVFGMLDYIESNGTALDAAIARDLVNSLARRRDEKGGWTKDAVYNSIADSAAYMLSSQDKNISFSDIESIVKKLEIDRKLDIARCVQWSPESRVGGAVYTQLRTQVDKRYKTILENSVERMRADVDTAIEMFKNDTNPIFLDTKNNETLFDAMRHGWERRGQSAYRMNRGFIVDAIVSSQFYTSNNIEKSKIYRAMQACFGQLGLRKKLGLENDADFLIGLGDHVSLEAAASNPQLMQAVVFGGKRFFLYTKDGCEVEFDQKWIMRNFLKIYDNETLGIGLTSEQFERLLRENPSFAYVLMPHDISASYSQGKMSVMPTRRFKSFQEFVSTSVLGKKRPSPEEDGAKRADKGTSPNVGDVDAVWDRAVEEAEEMIMSDGKHMANVLRVANAIVRMERKDGTGRFHNASSISQLSMAEQREVVDEAIDVLAKEIVRRRSNRKIWKKGAKNSLVNSELNELFARLSDNAVESIRRSTTGTYRTSSELAFDETQREILKQLTDMREKVRALMNVAKDSTELSTENFIQWYIEAQSRNMEFSDLVHEKTSGIMGEVANEANAEIQSTMSSIESLIEQFADSMMNSSIMDEYLAIEELADYLSGIHDADNKAFGNQHHTKNAAIESHLETMYQRAYDQVVNMLNADKLISDELAAILRQNNASLTHDASRAFWVSKWINLNRANGASFVFDLNEAIRAMSKWPLKIAEIDNISTMVHNSIGKMSEITRISENDANLESLTKRIDAAINDLKTIQKFKKKRSQKTNESIQKDLNELQDAYDAMMRMFASMMIGSRTSKVGGDSMYNNDILTSTNDMLAGFSEAFAPVDENDLAAYLNKNNENIENGVEQAYNSHTNSRYRFDRLVPYIYASDPLVERQCAELVSDAPAMQVPTMTGVNGSLMQNSECIGWAVHGLVDKREASDIPFVESRLFSSKGMNNGAFRITTSNHVTTIDGNPDLNGSYITIPKGFVDLLETNGLKLPEAKNADGSCLITVDLTDLTGSYRRIIDWFNGLTDQNIINNAITIGTTDATTRIHLPDVRDRLWGKGCSVSSILADIEDNIMEAMLLKYKKQLKKDTSSIVFTVDYAQENAHNYNVYHVMRWNPKRKNNVLQSAPKTVEDFRKWYIDARENEISDFFSWFLGEAFQMKGYNHQHARMLASLLCSSIRVSFKDTDGHSHSVVLNYETIDNGDTNALADTIVMMAELDGAENFTRENIDMDSFDFAIMMETPTQMNMRIGNGMVNGTALNHEGLKSTEYTDDKACAKAAEAYLYGYRGWSSWGKSDRSRTEADTMIRSMKRASSSGRYGIYSLDGETTPVQNMQAEIYNTGSTGPSPFVMRGIPEIRYRDEATKESYKPQDRTSTKMTNLREAVSNLILSGKRIAHGVSMIVGKVQLTSGETGWQVNLDDLFKDKLDDLESARNKDGHGHPELMKEALYDEGTNTRIPAREQAYIVDVDLNQNGGVELVAESIKSAIEHGTKIIIRKNAAQSDELNRAVMEKTGLSLHDLFPRSSYYDVNFRDKNGNQDHRYTVIDPRDAYERRYISEEGMVKFPRVGVRERHERLKIFQIEHTSGGKTNGEDSSIFLHPRCAKSIAYTRRTVLKVTSKMLGIDDAQPDLSMKVMSIKRIREKMKDNPDWKQKLIDDAKDPMGYIEEKSLAQGAISKYLDRIEKDNKFRQTAETEVLPGQVIAIVAVTNGGKTTYHPIYSSDTTVSTVYDLSWNRLDRITGGGELVIGGHRTYGLDSNRAAKFNIKHWAFKTIGVAYFGNRAFKTYKVIDPLTGNIVDEDYGFKVIVEDEMYTKRTQAQSTMKLLQNLFYGFRINWADERTGGRRFIYANAFLDESTGKAKSWVSDVEVEIDSFAPQHIKELQSDDKIGRRVSMKTIVENIDLKADAESARWVSEMVRAGRLTMFSEKEYLASRGADTDPNSFNRMIDIVKSFMRACDNHGMNWAYYMCMTETSFKHGKTVYDYTFNNTEIDGWQMLFRGWKQDEVLLFHNLLNEKYCPYTTNLDDTGATMFDDRGNLLDSDGNRTSVLIGDLDPQEPDSDMPMGSSTTIGPQLTTRQIMRGESISNDGVSMMMAHIRAKHGDFKEQYRYMAYDGTSSALYSGIKLDPEKKTIADILDAAEYYDYTSYEIDVQSQKRREIATRRIHPALRMYYKQMAKYAKNKDTRIRFKNDNGEIDDSISVRSLILEKDSLKRELESLGFHIDRMSDKALNDLFKAYTGAWFEGRSDADSHAVFESQAKGQVEQMLKDIRDYMKDEKIEWPIRRKKDVGDRIACPGVQEDTLFEMTRYGLFGNENAFVDQVTYRIADNEKFHEVMEGARAKMLAECDSQVAWIKSMMNHENMAKVTSVKNMILFMKYSNHVKPDANMLMSILRTDDMSEVADYMIKLMSKEERETYELCLADKKIFQDHIQQVINIGLGDYSWAGKDEANPEGFVTTVAQQKAKEGALAYYIMASRAAALLDPQLFMGSTIDTGARLIENNMFERVALFFARKFHTDTFFDGLADMQDKKQADGKLFGRIKAAASNRTLQDFMMDVYQSQYNDDPFKGFQDATLNMKNGFATDPETGATLYERLDSRYQKLASFIGGNKFFKRAKTQRLIFGTIVWLKHMGCEELFVKDQGGKSMIDNLLDNPADFARFLLNNDMYKYALFHGATYARSSDMSQTDFITNYIKVLNDRSGGKFNALLCGSGLKFANFYNSSMKNILKWICPISTIWYLETERLSNPEHWLNKLIAGENAETVAAQIEMTQAKTSLKAAIWTDAAYMGIGNLAMIIFGTALLQPPHDDDGEDDEDKFCNVNEWTFCGIRIDAEWWIEDTIGMPLAIAAFWKSCQLGKPTPELVLNTFSEFSYWHPWTDVFDFLDLAFNPEAWYIKQADIAEAYDDESVSFGSYAAMQFELSGANLLFNSVCPSIFKQWYRMSTEYEKSYKTTYDDDGNVIDCDWNESQWRKVARSNPLAAIALDLVNGTDTYWAENMPNTVYYDQYQLDSMEMFDIYEEDGVTLKANYDEIVGQVITTLKSTDDMEALWESGFYIPYTTKSYLSTYLYNQKQAIWDEYYEQMANGYFDWDTYGYDECQRRQQAYMDEIDAIETLYDKLWSEPMRRSLVTYNRLNTTYQRDANGNWYATGFINSPAQIILPFNLAYDSPDYDSAGGENSYTTNSVLNGQPMYNEDGTPQRALVPEYELEDYVSMDEWADKAGSDDDDDSSSSGTNYSSGGSGGSGGRSSSGYSSPNTYARTATTYTPNFNIQNPDRIYDSSLDYLRPNFTTKGSRQAYRREDY